jgi:hypothetical protein
VSESASADAVAKPRELSGTAVVIGLFLLGLVAVVVMFVYWDLHTRPFRPLTEAVGREFQNSLPKVEGGRHKGGPMTLRISLRVPFTPNAMSPDAHRVVNRLVELARQHAPLEQYEVFEVHLVELRPEAEAVQQAFEFPASEVRERLPFGEPVRDAMGSAAPATASATRSIDDTLLYSFDAFEGDAVAGFWRPGDAGSGRYVPGAIVISNEYARSGSRAVQVTVHEGDVEQPGDDGQLTERAELDAGKRPVVGRDAWYGFSVLVPPAFPVVDTRLVIAQWKQTGVDGSPIVAQRYRGGEHQLSIRRPDAFLWKRYSLPQIEPGAWIDMVYHLRFSTGPDGIVEVWMNGNQVVTYRGVTAFSTGERLIYSKIGLYRDRWKEPMTLYFDNYTMGESFEAVDPARFDGAR